MVIQLTVILKTLLLVVLLVSAHTTSFAHNYYFGFAEVEYNFFAQRFEATLSVTTHDLEMVLRDQGQFVGDLETLDSSAAAIVVNYINSKFKISSEGNTCVFTLSGHETELTGKVNFYLESSQIEVENSIEVEFDILMDTFQEQQNKMTLYYREFPYTVSFTEGRKQQTIQLVNNKE